MQITANISIMVLTAAFVSYCHPAGRQGSIANMVDIVFLGVLLSEAIYRIVDVEHRLLFVTNI